MALSWQITGIGSEKIKAGLGMDAIEALLTGLRIAETFLTSYNESDAYGVKITWLGEDDLGFPFEEIPHAETSSIMSDDSPFKKAFDEFFLNYPKDTPS